MKKLSRSIYQSDHCDKTFKYEEIKQKHISISHKNIKIYCHYFNNSSECPFAEECVFLHMVSPVCRYGVMCVRDKCMFRHVDKEDDDEISNKNNDAIRLVDKEKDLDLAIVHVDTVQENQNVDVILIDSTFVVNDSHDISNSDDEEIGKNIPDKKDDQEGIVSDDEKNDKKVNPLQSVDNSNGGKTNCVQTMEV